MRNIIVNYNVPDIDHHNFYYVEGKKIPKPETNIVYAYIDKGGMLHATEWMDDASQYGNGVFLETDEIGNDHGLPTVNGNAYNIWDAGSNWVKTAKNTKEKFYTSADEGGAKIVTHPGKDDKQAECEILRQIYLQIRAVLEDEAEKLEEE